MNKMLSSWKEIAHFFGKGVRTVQRWEKTLDLPIRRPPGAPSNVVLARTSDLEEWMHRSAGLRAADAAEVAVSATNVDLNQAITDLEHELLAFTGKAPQLVGQVKTENEEPLDRLKRLTQSIRENASQSDNNAGLRRVA